MIKLVMQNDASLLGFIDDLNHSKPAVNVTLNSFVNDMKSLKNNLDAVVDLAREEPSALTKQEKEVSHFMSGLVLC